MYRVTALWDRREWLQEISYYSSGFNSFQCVMLTKQTEPPVF